MDLQQQRVGEGLTPPVNARFRVDSRGQLTPENAEAQKSLSAMAGNFYLLPTSPDLLCFVRTPSSGGRKTIE